MILMQAQRLAAEMADILKPYCTRVEIAGSVRRCKDEVKDIELVALPKLQVESVPDLFGMREVEVNALERFFEQGEHLGWSVLKGGERQKQLRLKAGINVDLFIVRPPAQWGVIFTIRTGSADFAHRLVTKRHYGGMLPSHLQVKDGGIYEGRKLIETPEEMDVFRLLGVDWIDPRARLA